KAAYGDSDKVSSQLVGRYHDLTFRQGNRKALVQVFRTMKEQSCNPQRGDEVKQDKATNLLMWGKEDNWVPLDVLAQFRRDLPVASVVTYEGVGHLPMEELPVQSARDAHIFLQTGQFFSMPVSMDN